MCFYFAEIYTYLLTYLQFGQNVVECQPALPHLPHVKSSHGILNILVVQQAIYYFNDFIKRLNLGAIL